MARIQNLADTLKLIAMPNPEKYRGLIRE
jgi:hypothetical protein